MSTTSLSEQTLDAITVSARAQADQLRNATRGRALAVSRFALRPSASPSPLPKASVQGHCNGVSGPVDSAVCTEHASVNRLENTYHLEMMFPASATANFGCC